jgi:hypothetical protein
MQIPVIKELVENRSVEELNLAEAALLEEQQPAIEIKGNDEGEQLTHILAALWIIQDMKANGTDFRTSLRNYTQKVRKSIG